MLTPIPKPIASNAAAVNAGLFQKPRTAYRMSCYKFENIYVLLFRGRSLSHSASTLADRKSSRKSGFAYKWLERLLFILLEHGKVDGFDDGVVCLIGWLSTQGRETCLKHRMVQACQD